MKPRHSYRWYVIGAYEIPPAGRGIGRRRREYVNTDPLTKSQAFEMANTLNRLNNLPLHEPK